MKISIVLPIKNEEDCILAVLTEIVDTLEKENVPYEMVCVNDNSTDGTLQILQQLAGKNKNIQVVNRAQPSGFGRAVKDGLMHATGDCMAIVMGDGSDDPADIVKYYSLLCAGYDCVFGSRFLRESKVRDYPKLKLFINRLANNFIRCLFLMKFNDTTNAFKAYRREVIEAVSPIQALHFNITAEIPLKALVRGFNYGVIPVNWYGRTSGVSKLKITDMGKKYLFTVLYVWLEKLLVWDDLPKKMETSANGT